MERFPALLVLCARNSPVTGEVSAQRPVMRSFDIFVDLRLKIRSSKKSWGWWFETPLRPLWCHCDVCMRNSHFCGCHQTRALFIYASAYKDQVFPPSGVDIVYLCYNMITKSHWYFFANFWCFDEIGWQRSISVKKQICWNMLTYSLKWCDTSSYKCMKLK